MSNRFQPCKLVDLDVLRRLDERASLAGSQNIESILKLRHQYDEIMASDNPPGLKLHKLGTVIFSLSKEQNVRQRDLNEMGAGGAPKPPKATPLEQDEVRPPSTQQPRRRKEQSPQSPIDAGPIPYRPSPIDASTPYSGRQRTRLFGTSLEGGSSPFPTPGMWAKVETPEQERLTRSECSLLRLHSMHAQTSFNRARDLDFR